MMDISSIRKRARTSGIISRVRDALGRSEFEAVIATTPENSYYLSGRWYPIGRNRPNRPNVVVWPSRGDPVLVIPVDQLAGFTRDSWIESVQAYDERGKHPVGAIVSEVVEVVRRLDLGSARLGIEYSFMPVEFYDLLAKSLPDATLVPCDKLFHELRMAKTDDELRIIRGAAVACERGLWEALQAAKVGWSERQLAQEITTQIVGRGVDAVTTILLGSGEGSLGYLTPTDHPMTVGEMVRIDINVMRDGYYADIGRMAFVGSAQGKYRRAYQLQRQLTCATASVMKPGIRTSEIFAYCEARAAELELRLVVQPYIGIGHGIGINNSEHPKLSRDDNTLLVPGMVLNIEPDAFGPLEEVMHFEEMILIGRGGSEVLTAGDEWDELPEIQG